MWHSSHEDQLSPGHPTLLTFSRAAYGMTGNPGYGTKIAQFARADMPREGDAAHASALPRTFQPDAHGIFHARQAESRTAITADVSRLSREGIYAGRRHGSGGAQETMPTGSPPHTPRAE
ncbi:hypothetical protein ACIHDR_44750 [Nocardia sp. NPDC052278]|uniref:hypothetical protein n=1 Tax=unclassified Nocardia TaxID=2637762 RepID=UPI003674130B